MEQFNYYKNINNEYDEEAIFYCNGPFLILVTGNKSIKVDDLNPNDWKIHNEPLIEKCRDMEVLILSYRSKLTGLFLQSYNNHFKITSTRYGKI